MKKGVCYKWVTGNECQGCSSPVQYWTILIDPKTLVFQESGLNKSVVDTLEVVLPIDQFGI